jgi:hypothetical protein
MKTLYAFSAMVQGAEGFYFLWGSCSGSAARSSMLAQDSELAAKPRKRNRKRKGEKHPRLEPEQTLR